MKNQTVGDIESRFKTMHGIAGEEKNGDIELWRVVSAGNSKVKSVIVDSEPYFSKSDRKLIIKKWAQLYGTLPTYFLTVKPELKNMMPLTLTELKEFYEDIQAGMDEKAIIRKFVVSKEYFLECVSAANLIWGDLRLQKSELKAIAQEPEENPAMKLKPSKKRIRDDIEATAYSENHEKPAYGTYVNGKLLRFPAEYTNSRPYDYV